ncbi:unnamed protein product, partial [Symbiodinium sp. CCMP2456]
MARSTFAVAVLMLMLPASARRNKDELFTMQAEAENSAARGLQADLESWLTSASVGLRQGDAEWWAKKEWWYMETCGATLSYLQHLHSVLTGSMSWSNGEAVQMTFEYARKQLDANQLLAMYNVLAHKLGLGIDAASVRAAALLKKDASPTELSDLYEMIKNTMPWLSWLVKSPEEAQALAMESAAAGCEPDKFKSAYQAHHDKKTAADEAIRASFNMQAYRYADDGKYYTASQFKGHYGDDWVAKWTASPVAQK